MMTTEYGIKSSWYKRWVLQPLGLNPENAMVFWLLILFGAITMWSLWYFEGDIPVMLAILYITGIFLLSFLRLDYSFYVLIGAVLILDQFAIPAFDSLTYSIGFFSEFKEISYLPFFETVAINPLELQLSFILFALFLLIAIKKDFTWRPIPVLGPFMLFALVFAIAFLNGLGDGSNFWVSLKEVRPFFYFFLGYLIAPQIIRSKEQVRILLWILIVAISFKAFQSIGRFMGMDSIEGGFQPLTSVEDPLFMVSIFVLLAGLWIFEVSNRQRIWLMILSLPLLAGFYLGAHSAVYVSLIVTLAAFVVLLPAGRFLRFLKFAVPVVVALAVYCTIFWNNADPIGRPIQSLKSGFTAEQDYTYVAGELGSRPILGTGFGQRTDQSTSQVLLWVSSTTGYQNGIFWVLTTMGIAGFLGFWFFVNAFIAKAVKVLRGLEDPYLKVIVLVVIIAVINQGVVAYFDLRFFGYRTMIFLGCLMGLLSSINHREEPADKTNGKILDKMLGRGHLQLPARFAQIIKK